MATSPRLSPRPNPAALATLLPVNRVLAGTNAVPARPTRFINVRRPRSPLRVVIDVCEVAFSALFRAESSRIDLFFILNGFVFNFWFLGFLFDRIGDRRAHV